ncbi:MAG: 1,2-phenylacetyl-CoA epoxidase subunit PaaC [Candidatus Cyclobacteriaceae bacterium M2_1C_046]
MREQALKDLLYKIADDQLILGHRNSEWTGLGPLLEEDIAFSSMAQDKIGQSLAFYTILHEMGEKDPDTVAFMRNAEQFHNCQLVELPIGAYDFSLIRHFLFDHAEAIRFEMLSSSSVESIAEISRKITSEIRYHTMHANVFIKRLGSATEDSVQRLQKSLDEALPYALGIFEPSEYEQVLQDEKIFAGEAELQKKWQVKIEEVISQTSLNLPSWSEIKPVYGGRKGQHTEHLQPLLDEMAEVFKIDPTAEW